MFAVGGEPSKGRVGVVATRMHAERNVMEIVGRVAARGQEYEITGYWAIQPVYSALKSAVTDTSLTWGTGPDAGSARVRDIFLRKQLSADSPDEPCPQSVNPELRIR